MHRAISAKRIASSHQVTRRKLCDDSRCRWHIDANLRLCEIHLGEIMTIDWISTLQEQEEFANQIAEDVRQTLEISDLSVAQAARLYRVVEQGAQTFDRIMDEMEGRDGIDDELRDGAETIADMWTNLSVTTANKVRVMQGLKPQELPWDDQG